MTARIRGQSHVGFACDGGHMLLPWKLSPIVPEIDVADPTRLVLAVRLPEGWTERGGKHYCPGCSTAGSK